MRAFRRVAGSREFGRRRHWPNPARGALERPEPAGHPAVHGREPGGDLRDGAAAARAAGVEPRLTAHSGRVGLASELTARGASAHDVMRAGNWKTVRLVAHYSAGASAERGAVARYL